MRYLVLILPLLLLGCFGTTQTKYPVTPEKGLVLTCSDYAVALERLVPFKQQMTVAQVEIVDGAVAIIEPVCAQIDALPPDADYVGLLRRVNQELGKIIAVQNEVKA